MSNSINTRHWRKAAAVWLAVGATLALAACGGSGGGSSAAPKVAQRNESAIATAQAGDLLDFVKGKLAARGPQGSQLIAMSGPITTAPTPGPSSAGSDTVSASGTVVQEAGVDEDDLLKTDGSRIYTLQPLQASGGTAPTAFARLAIYTKGADGRPQAAGSVALASDGPNTVVTRGMLLADGVPRVAVVGEGFDWTSVGPDCRPNAVCTTALMPYWQAAPKVHLQLLDVSNADKPGTPERLTIDGSLIGTRQIGRMLYLVASHAPSFAFDRLPIEATEAERAASLAALTVADIVPKVSINGGPSQPLLADTDCWLQKNNASSQVALTTLTAIDLGSPTWARSTRCFAGGTEALYMSTSSIYIATSRNEFQIQQNRTVFAPDMNTDIHKFSVDGANFNYRGSGSVKGNLGWDRDRTPYRLSEHNGDLRVLSFTGQTGWLTPDDAASTLKPSPATLTVLRERTSDASLQTVATLPNAQRPEALGKPGEQVYAVRFLGDRGYVVTFRRTDPLYVLDLSNPADPRTAGVLEVPGFSDWLFPLDGGLLFGVGKDASEQGQVLGVKVALFDVRDAANPKLLDSKRFGQAGSSSGLDYSSHGIAQLGVANRTRLALPVISSQNNDTQRTISLQRFEVDSSARTLNVKPAIELGESTFDLFSARSLLQGELVHYLSDGALRSWAW